MGFRVVGESEVMLMLDDLRGRNYREANIYLVLRDPVFAVEWRLDEEVVRHVPQPEAAKLDKCILEELPSDSELVPDVVVNPRGHHDPNDAFYNKFVRWGDLAAQWIDEEVDSRECSPQPGNTMPETIDISSSSSSESEEDDDANDDDGDDDDDSADDDGDEDDGGDDDGDNEDDEGDEGDGEVDDRGDPPDDQNISEIMEWAETLGHLDDDGGLPTYPMPLQQIPPQSPPRPDVAPAAQGNDGSTRSLEVEITGYKEVEESPRARRLRQRRRLRFSAQSQPQPHTQPEPNIEPETILPTPQPEPQTEPHLETEPHPEIETQPDFEPHPEVEESARGRKLRQRRNYQFPHAETQPETQQQPEPDILTQPEYEFPSQSTQPDPLTQPETHSEPQTQPETHSEPQTQAEADFVLHEEEYCGEPEVERHGYTQPDSCDWWGRHTELVPDALCEDEGDIGEETEMGSVHSDEENESAGPYKLPYNPDTNLENLEWKPYMEFASIEVLRKTIRAYFIHQNKEYILKANDSKKFRVKCSVEGCPWMLYAYVKQDGKTFRVLAYVSFLQKRESISKWKGPIQNNIVKITTKLTEGKKNKGGRPPIQNPNKETLKRRKRREMEQARKARQAAEGGGPGSVEAGGSNP
ncbi:hypothetical protein G4B88_026712 [Cannabis sativa]|uniref:Transposase MuDR plant domain-containing protein n=1 Tax=Cannabis sativa TaxID=3483 RepID=A0A7J6DUS5_CANSA|nr:hypothetical protein G4B88_026712 [Cannabis sativa]